MSISINIGTNSSNPYVNEPIPVADEPSNSTPVGTNGGMQPTNSPAVVVSLSANAETALGMVAQGYNTSAEPAARDGGGTLPGNSKTERPEVVVINGQRLSYTVDGWNEQEGFTGSGGLTETLNDAPPAYHFLAKPYDTAKAALKSIVARIQNDNNRHSRELGYFMVKENGQFFLAQVSNAGSGDVLGNFRYKDVPPNAIGFVHTHPPGGIEPGTEGRNRWPSVNDLDAWNTFERWTGNNDFEIYIVGPDGEVRLFDDQDTDIPKRFDDDDPSFRPPADTETGETVVF